MYANLQNELVYVTFVEFPSLPSFSFIKKGLRHLFQKTYDIPKPTNALGAL